MTEPAPREARVLRLVSDYQLSHGEPPRIDEVLLKFHEFPDLAREAVRQLVRDRYIEQKPRSRILSLTVLGLQSSGSLLLGPLSLIAERLVSYFQVRARREASGFASYTWQDLIDNHVVSGDEDFPVALGAIRILRLSGGGDLWSSGTGSRPSGQWTVPRDLLDLLRVSEIGDIYDRAQLLWLLETPFVDEIGVLQIPRTRLLDLQEALAVADQTGQLEGVAVIVSEIMRALSAGAASERLQEYHKAVEQPGLSDYRRTALLRALAQLSRHLHRTAEFEPSTAVEPDSYIRFLEAALREDRDLGLGMTISLAAIKKRARLDSRALHAAVARSLDDELTHVSDIDEQLYSIQISDEEDVSSFIAKFRKDALRAVTSPTTVGNNFHAPIGAVAAAPGAIAHGAVPAAQTGHANTGPQPACPTASIGQQDVRDGGIGVLVNPPNHFTPKKQLLFEDLKALRDHVRGAMTQARAYRPPFHEPTPTGPRPDSSFEDFLANLTVDDSELQRLARNFASEANRLSRAILDATDRLADPDYGEVDRGALRSALSTGESAKTLAGLERLYQHICERIETLLA